jgi:hypothetical protein
MSYLCARWLKKRSDEGANARASQLNTKKSVADKTFCFFIVLFFSRRAEASSKTEAQRALFC